MNSTNRPGDENSGTRLIRLVDTSEVVGRLGNLDELDMYSLGELYVSLILHAVPTTETNHGQVAALNDAIDAFFEITSAANVAELLDLRHGINEALCDAALGNPV